MRHLFLICGLNRSGTSTLTGALARSGVSLDFEQPGLEPGLHKDDPQRPDGGYESYEIPAILELTRQILQRHYASQNYPPPGDDIRLTVPEILTIVALTDAIPRFPFALKDPVFTFLFKAWKRVVEDHLADIEVVPIATVRHPAVQAEALLRRGFCGSFRSGLERWLRYHCELVGLAESESLHVVIYDRQRDSFLSQIEALASNLDLTFDRDAVDMLFRPNEAKSEAKNELDDLVLKNHPLGAAILQLFESLERLSYQHRNETVKGNAHV